MIFSADGLLPLSPSASVASLTINFLLKEGLVAFALFRGNGLDSKILPSSDDGVAQESAGISTIDSKDFHNFWDASI
jgi:hypothetical protein